MKHSTKEKAGNEQKEIQENQHKCHKIRQETSMQIFGAFLTQLSQ